MNLMCVVRLIYFLNGKYEFCSSAFLTILHFSFSKPTDFLWLTYVEHTFNVCKLSSMRLHCSEESLSQKKEYCKNNFNMYFIAFKEFLFSI